jgi:hypothetical protein
MYLEIVLSDCPNKQNERLFCVNCDVTRLLMGKLNKIVTRINHLFVSSKNHMQGTAF